MAPLVIACGLVPRDEATSVPNSADYGCCTSSSSHASKATTPKHSYSSPAELNCMSYGGGGGSVSINTSNNTSDASSSSSSLTGIPPGQSPALPLPLPLSGAAETRGQRARRRRLHVVGSGSGSESRGGKDEGHAFVTEEERGERELSEEVERGVVGAGSAAGDKSLTVNMDTTNGRGPAARKDGSGAEAFPRNGGGGDGRRRRNRASRSSDRFGASSVEGRDGEERLGGEESDVEGEGGKHPGFEIENLNKEDPSFYLGSINAGSDDPLPFGSNRGSRRSPVVENDVIVQQRHDRDNDEHVSFPTPATTTNNATARHHSNLVEDLLQVLDRPIFVLVVFGAAANAAVTAGMSTFGTGFITALELLHSETAAAATFGVVICAAGLVGTPAGGALIDSADPEGRLGDEKKLAVVMRQAMLLVCCATGECCFGVINGGREL